MAALSWESSGRSNVNGTSSELLKEDAMNRRSLWAVAVLLGLVLSLGLAPAASAASNVVVKFHVHVGGAPGLGIPGCTVYVYTPGGAVVASGTTNLLGNVNLTLAEGSYRYAVERNGTYSALRDLQVTCSKIPIIGGCWPMDVNHRLSFVQISVRDGGSVVLFPTIRIYNSAGALFSEESGGLDGEGHFALVDGAYTYEVVKDCYTSARIPFNVSYGTDYEFTHNIKWVTAVCKNISISLGANGQATISGADIDGGSTASCGIASRTVSKSIFTCADKGANVVTLTVKDTKGHSATCQATVTVVDGTAPVITTCASNKTIEADANCKGTIPDLTGEVVATDNCGGSLTITQSPAAGTLVGLGDHAVTITVKDAAGNTTTCQATVTVRDTIAPVVDLTSPANGAMLNQTVNIVGSVTDANPTTLSLTIDGQQVATSLPYAWDTTQWNDGDHVIRLTGTDCAGNSRFDEITVTLDNTPPELPLITGLQSPGLGGGSTTVPLSIMGVTEDGARLVIEIQMPGMSGFVAWGGTIADPCGRWSYEGPISVPGQYLIRVGAKDALGNWSGWSEPFELTVGTSPLEVVAFQEGEGGYAGTTDATLDGWSVGTNYGDKGELLVRAGGIREAALRFDLSSLPEGATVQRAVLVLYVGERTNGLPLTLDAYELLRPWTERQVTWASTGTGAWAIAGANGVGSDRAGQAAASTTAIIAPGWVMLDLTDLVAKWAADGSTNQGILLKGTAPGAVEYAIRSSEWWQVCRRPRLMVILSQ